MSAVVKRQKGNTLTVARPQTEYHDELYATRMTRQEQLLFDFQRSAEEAQRSEYAECTERTWCDTTGVVRSHLENLGMLEVTLWLSLVAAHFDRSFRS